MKCGGPWGPVALRCYIGERPSSTRYWDQGFALTSASAAAAWANPEDIRQGCWREVLIQDTARTPPQTQKTEETAQAPKRLPGGSSNSKAFEKRYQHTLAICWEGRGNAVRPLSWGAVHPGFSPSPHCSEPPTAPIVPTCLQEDAC